MDYIIRFTGKEQAALEQLERPDSPYPHHILGKTLYSLISPGTELQMGFLQEHVQPAATGYASVLQVEQIGEGVTSAAIGDRYLCMYNHQSFQHLPVMEAIPLPAGIDPSVAVIARLLNIGMTSLMTTKARPGDKILITGAGPIGFLSALLFQRSGYNVLLCDPDEERLIRAQKAGVKHISKQIPVDGAFWKGNVALVLECSGNEAAAIESCKMIRKGGELVLAGVPWKRYTDSYAHELLSLVFHQYITLRSGWEWELPRFSLDFMPYSVQSNLETGLQWLADGLLGDVRQIRKVSPLEAQDAYSQLANRTFTELFIMFDWTQMGADN